MRIAMTCFHGDAGIAHYTHFLSTALQESGHQVTLWTNRNYEFDSAKQSYEVRRVFRRRRQYSLDMATVLLDIRRFRPEFIHIQSVISPLVELAFCRAARMIGSGLVMTAHDILPHQPKMYDRAIYRALYRSVDALFVHADQNKRTVTGELGLDPARVVTIPMGNFILFDVSDDRDAALKFLGLEPDDEVVLFFGAIRPDKGLDYAIRAFPSVLRAHPKAKLVIAGRVKGSIDEAERLYGGLIRSCGIADRTVLRFGYVPIEEAPRYFEAARLVVLPYIESSQSGMVQLAYGSKKAVVVTSVGGLPELVEDGVTGIIVSPKNEEQLGEAIVKLLDDPEGTSAMGIRAYEKAEREFSWKAIAAATENTYLSIKHSNRTH